MGRCMMGTKESQVGHLLGQSWGRAGAELGTPPGLDVSVSLGLCLGEESEESDKEDEEELDKKMGDLGEGQTDTLDERMWGDDEEDEDLEGSDKEEESGQGMDQVWTRSGLSSRPSA